MLIEKTIIYDNNSTATVGDRYSLYYDDSVSPKTLIIYIHGGGLLYGSRRDLPELHLNKFTGEGFAILAIDYPLAPQVRIDSILTDITSSINMCFDISMLSSELPVFIWGRSAGAYLALLASVSPCIKIKLNGLISYYGYGFLSDGWYDSPSKFYLNHSLVPVEHTKIESKEISYCGSLNEYYSTYVYARQTGSWKNLIYEGRDKYFFLNYTLRAADNLPTPLFAAHSTGDTDVPYEEFVELTNKYKAVKFIASVPEHDFDRNTDDQFTVSLLNETIKFIEDNL